MNELVNRSAISAPINFATSDDFKSHSVRVEGYKEPIYCTKFYKVDEFVCLENMKLCRTRYSDIDLVPRIGWADRGTYIFMECSDAYRKEVVGYYTADTKTIRMQQFIQANSFKNNEEAEDGLPQWAFISKKEAVEKANILETKNNEDINKLNEKVVSDIVNAVYEDVIDIIYHRLGGVKKFFNSKKSLFKELNKKYPMDKFDIEGFVREKMIEASKRKDGLCIELLPLVKEKYLCT